MEYSDCAGGKDAQSLLFSYFRAELGIYVVSKGNTSLALEYKLCG